jgi:pimeloyl-ACP methyl ester carboxylesterase
VRSFVNAGLNLAYDVVGDGFPVVLHTGGAGDSRMWRDAGVAPTLIIAGDHESGNCAATAAAIPDGRIVVLSGLGHLGAFADSEQALRHVRPFLNRTTGSEDTARREPADGLHR